MLQKYNISAIATICLALTACGGGGDDEESTTSMTDQTTDINTETDTNSDNTNNGNDVAASVLTGVFVDSAVEGVTYTTATQSGVTNSAGEYNYLAGEQVTFSIGATQLPVVTAAPQVSPVEMAASTSNPTATTTNIARLLQSLDVDGNPDNGITISSTAAANAAFINFNVSTDQFANDANVINLVANSGSSTTSLISAADANAHLNDTLGIVLPEAPSDNDDNVTLTTLAGFYDSRADVTDRLFYLLLNSDGSGVEYAQSRDDETCFETTTLTISPLGGDLFLLDRSDRDAEQIRLARQNGNLIVNSDQPNSVSFPQILDFSPSDLSLCI